MRRQIYISEIFQSIQGEGALIGRPTVFVRTGGCDFQHCSWCDTLYAVLPEYRKTWELLEPEEIFARVQALSGVPVLITLSGGNPAIEPLEPLIDLGHAKGYPFAIETQGSVAKSWFAKLEHLTLSPKPPSSGMVNNWKRVDQCLDVVSYSRHCSVSLKVVVFDEADYLFAKSVAVRYPAYRLYVQTGNSHVGTDFSLDKVLERTRWLAERVKQDLWNDVTVLPQMHTILWGSQRGI